jgi:hypothetical protein
MPDRQIDTRTIRDRERETLKERVLRFRVANTMQEQKGKGERKEERARTAQRVAGSPHVHLPHESPPRAVADPA